MVIILIDSHGSDIPLSLNNYSYSCTSRGNDPKHREEWSDNRISEVEFINKHNYW